MKHTSLLTLTFILLALTGWAQAQTQVSPADPAAPIKRFYSNTKQNLIGAAEKMPAGSAGRSRSK